MEAVCRGLKTYVRVWVKGVAGPLEVFGSAPAHKHVDILQTVCANGSEHFNLAWSPQSPNCGAPNTKFPTENR